MAQRKEHIVIFPFMAQGHIIPFLALALQIEQKKGYNITFVNTPLNIKKLRSSLPQNSSIRLLEIPFCSTDHGLPPNCENTNDLPFHLLLKLFQASLSLKPAFKKLMHDLVREQDGQPPLCIITDLYFGWCADVAHELGVFHALFSIASGFGMACYFSLCANLPHLKAKSEEFMLPDLEGVKVHMSQLSEGLKSAYRTESFSKYLKEVIREGAKADGCLVNTVEELDDIGIMYFRQKLDKPVWAVGPLLLLPTDGNRAGKEAGITTDYLKNWLDSKPPNSVLYISFGSQNTPSPQQMMQLAMALEASGKNFIWVVRPPVGFEINSEFKADEFLPKGFEERMLDQERGLLVRNWAPQLEILSHKSTGAFFTHCGWSSVLEALIQGLPLLGWPMATEQFFNAMLLVQGIGVCVEVARGKTCEVKHEDIAAKIVLVMNETEEGKKTRRRACEVRETLKNAVRDEEGYKGDSIKALDDFFNVSMRIREEHRGQNKRGLI